MGKKDFLEKYKDQRQPALVWSRCMGYYRNVTSFNAGKQSEFNERQFFRVKGTV